jgi:phosphoglycolate phosphatase-like HAD superfamily hydrolase
VLAPNNNAIAAEMLSKEFGCDEKELYHELDSSESEFSTGPESEEYYLRISRMFSIPSDVIKKTLNDIGVWEVFSLAKKLKSGGFDLHILSDQMKPKTDAIRKNHDLTFFNDAFFSNEMGLKKPDRETFEFVLRKIGKPANACLFIDDRSENIRMAKSMGMETILFKNMEQLIMDLSSFSIEVK